MKLRLVVCLFVFLLGGVSFAEAVAVPRRLYQEPFPAQGKQVWLSPLGSDATGDGSVERPFATPGRAAERVKPGDILVLQGGTYTAFGELHASGTAEQPLTIRPAPGARVVFALDRADDGIRVIGSHWHVEGLEVYRSDLSGSEACVRLADGVKDVILLGLSIHDCAQGMRIGDRDTVESVIMEDVTIKDVTHYGVVCAGACQEIILRRVEINGLASSVDSAAVSFSALSKNVYIEDSEFLEINGMGIRSFAPNLVVSNTVMRDVRGRVVELHKGGSILNSDIETTGEGIWLQAGYPYRLRGNLIIFASTSSSYPLKVVGPTQASTSLILDGNRLALSHGRLGLPAMGETLDYSVHVTLRSNTFFFAEETDGAEFGTYYVSSTGVASANGPGITNLRLNIAVVGEPESVDLISPIYVGPQSDPDAVSGGVFIQAGTPIKGSGPTVYLYAEDRQRHAFLNESAYRSWFKDFSPVVQIDDEALAKISLGEPMTYRPGTVLLKRPTDPKVYAISQSRTLRWISSEPLAESVFGSAWKKMVLDISEETFAEYQIGQPVLKADDYHPETERAHATDPSQLFLTVDI